MAAMKATTVPFAEEVLKYINKSWTPFHAVDEAAKLLSAAKFRHLNERDNWKLQRGGKYYFTRNQSTLVAFAVGSQYDSGNGFNMIGAHTDSPCLKLKPKATKKKSEYLVLNVEPYGGGLWHTWFDRDLSIAGRVIVRESDEKLTHRLVKIERPILRIPMLAIHLYRDIITEGFKLNKQEHLAPVLATYAASELDTSNGIGSHPALMKLLAEELKCDVDAIVDFELHLCDTQPGVIAGAANEFVFVGRLDNLCSSYCSLMSLIDSCNGHHGLEEEDRIRAVALFDHEEVGSDSAQGAGGPVMRDTITRVTRCLSDGESDVVERALASSFLVSADMAHAIHPNYTEKHDSSLAPKFNKGVVVKTNVNQRYATNLVSSALFIEVGRRRGIPSQHFSVRNDIPCGSTIGPILASNLGCRTVDVGVPQLSMHSIREMCGVDDMELSYKHFKAFFELFNLVDKSLDVDGIPPSEGILDEPDCGCLHGSNGH